MHNRYWAGALPGAMVMAVPRFVRTEGHSGVNCDENKLHVGNLSSRATEKNLRFLFAQKGRVRDVELTIERTVGRSRAFAIVTMATVEGAQAALLALHRSIWNGRHITVNEVPVAPVENGEFSFGAQQTITPFFPIRTKTADEPEL